MLQIRLPTGVAGGKAISKQYQREIDWSFVTKNDVNVGFETFFNLVQDEFF